jgi:hypothetical protein
VGTTVTEVSAIDFIEDAVTVLGGEDTEFYLTAVEGKYGDMHALKVNCCYDDCGWHYLITQVDLWEVVADCREHWENYHAAKS